MIDTDRYTEDVEEKYNLIMNLMDEVEREFEIKTRIRLSNKMKAAIDKLDTEVKRLREENEHIRMLYEALYLDWRKMWDTLDNMGKAKEMRQHFPNTFPETMDEEMLDKYEGQGD